MEPNNDNKPTENNMKSIKFILDEETMVQILKPRLNDHILGTNMQIQGLQVIDMSKGEPLDEEDYKVTETSYINMHSEKAILDYKVGRLPNLVRELIRETAGHFPHRKLTVVVDVTRIKNQLEVPHITMVLKGAYDPERQSKLRCMICDIPFDDRRTFIMHKRTHYKNSKYKCQSCSREYTYMNTLLQHVRLHSVKSPFRCEICSKIFTQKNRLEAHKRGHDGILYTCVHCPDTFKSLSAYRAHWNTHSTERPFKCVICARSYARQNDYNRHIKSLKHLNKSQRTLKKKH